MKDTKMVINTKEIFIMARHMGKVYILGLMERYMTESGRMELKMAMVYGKECLGILI